MAKTHYVMYIDYRKSPKKKMIGPMGLNAAMEKKRALEGSCEDGSIVADVVENTVVRADFANKCLL